MPCLCRPFEEALFTLLHTTSVCSILRNWNLLLRGKRVIMQSTMNVVCRGICLEDVLVLSLSCVGLFLCGLFVAPLRCQITFS